MAGDRDAFLSRVRDAAARARHYPVRVVEDFSPTVGYVGGGPDVVARLAAEFEAVGGIVHLATSVDEVRCAIQSILANVRSSPTRTAGPAGQGLPEGTTAPPIAIRWQHPLLDRIDLDSVLEVTGFSAVSCLEREPADADPRNDRLFAAAVGISSVDWAVAETGSLVVAARPGQSRSASLLPPVHIAVVERNQIVPDVFDLFEELASEVVPSSVVLVTGPSKTGDIELKLTTGVHGPGEVHLVILDHDRLA